MTPVGALETVLAECLTSRPPPRRRRVEIALDDPGPPVEIRAAGFYPSRWVAYCDDYLGGGPLMDDWLADPAEPLQFLNGAAHRLGPCVERLSASGGRLTLESRACSLVPTGLLDLKLLQMAWMRLGLTSALWVVEDLSVDPLSVPGYAGWRGLLPAAPSAFARRALAAADGTSDEALDKRRPGMLGRHKKAVRRDRAPIQTDESRIASSFTFAVPRDFVWESAGAVRESWITRATGRKGYGEYQWNHLDYEELAPVLARMPRRPDLRAMASRRAARG